MHSSVKQQEKTNAENACRAHPAAASQGCVGLFLFQVGGKLKPSGQLLLVPETGEAVCPRKKSKCPPAA